MTWRPLRQRDRRGSTDGGEPRLGRSGKRWRPIETAATEADPVPGHSAGAAAALRVSQGHRLRRRRGECGDGARRAQAWCPAGARILTHCNTGCLVSGGRRHCLRGDPRRAPGRATRPIVGRRDPAAAAGARLTTWEARRAGSRMPCYPTVRPPRCMAAGRSRPGTNRGRPDCGRRKRGEQDRHLRPRRPGQAPQRALRRGSAGVHSGPGHAGRRRDCCRAQARRGGGQSLPVSRSRHPVLGRTTRPLTSPHRTSCRQSSPNKV